MGQLPGQLPEEELAMVVEIHRESVLAVEFAFGPGVPQEEGQAHKCALRSGWSKANSIGISWADTRYEPHVDTPAQIRKARLDCH
jgi:hypothetical protein